MRGRYLCFQVSRQSIFTRKIHQDDPTVVQRGAEKHNAPAPAPALAPPPAIGGPRGRQHRLLSSCTPSEANIPFIGTCLPLDLFHFSIGGKRARKIRPVDGGMLSLSNVNNTSHFTVPRPPVSSSLFSHSLSLSLSSLVSHLSHARLHRADVLLLAHREVFLNLYTDEKNVGRTIAASRHRKGTKIRYRSKQDTPRRKRSHEKPRQHHRRESCTDEW